MHDIIKGIDISVQERSICNQEEAYLLQILPVQVSDCNTWLRPPLQHLTTEQHGFTTR